MDKSIPLTSINKVSDYLFVIPKTFRRDMRVDAHVYVNEKLLSQVAKDSSLWQLVNMTTLPGIEQYALAMPDIHEGYGFPIGGVAAMNVDEEGVISPGGIGYDINCGVRLLISNLEKKDVLNRLDMLTEEIFRAVPSGVGRAGNINLTTHELDLILEKGAERMVQLGFGDENDLNHCESKGRFNDANASLVSGYAKSRGQNQLGTLGSGNHFLELQFVDEIFDQKTALAFGLRKDQITAMIHCGSRGLGHQVCTDYVRVMLNAQDKFSIPLVDRQLACAPFRSTEGQEYFSAMQAAANFAWANRHVIGHHIREAFVRVYGNDSYVRTLYDVAHNIGKVEHHHKKKLIVHRKGATRAFGPGQRDLASDFISVGQPVLIPGTMGTASYILVGTEEAMKISFGSACHGAGRTMSRHTAKKQESSNSVRKNLSHQGILVVSDSRNLSEEAPYAYKDIDDVIDVVHGALLAHKIARLRPLAVIKGD